MGEIVTGLVEHCRYIAAMRFVVECSRTHFYVVLVRSFYGFEIACIRATLDVKPPTK